MSRSRANTFIEVSHNQDAATQLRAMEEENLWNEQRHLHKCLLGEWAFKGRFDAHGNVVKVPKEHRQIFEVSLHPAVVEYQKKKDARTVGDNPKPKVSVVFTAKSLGSQVARYLPCIQTNKPEPWRFATLHVLAPKEVPCIVPPPMKDVMKEKQARRMEASKNRRAGKKVTINAQEKLPGYNPDVRIRKGGELGFADSDFVMNIGSTTVYGHLDSKMNFLKVLFSLHRIEYGVFQRVTKYAGPDRFKSSRLDWGARLGFMISIRLSDRSTPGAVISNVHPGSPAEVAGFRLFDHIISIDGHPVSNNSDLKVALRRLEADKEVVWRLIRNGQTVECLLALTQHFDPTSASHDNEY